MGKAIGASVNESAGRRQVSSRPRDEMGLPARAQIAYGHLDGKITTYKEMLEDLDGRIQELAGEMQDMQQEVDGGKLLDPE